MREQPGLPQDRLRRLRHVAEGGVVAQPLQLPAHLWVPQLRLVPWSRESPSTWKGTVNQKSHLLDVFHLQDVLHLQGQGRAVGVPAEEPGTLSPCSDVVALEENGSRVSGYMGGGVTCTRAVPH